jgi:hypothetical protein
MPPVEVVFYKEENETVPVLEWLDEMHRRDPRIVHKMLDRIDLLKERGHELQRPLADYLRDGIYELRGKFGSVNYRILYFFHDDSSATLGLLPGSQRRQSGPSRQMAEKRKTVAVLANGLTKETKVPGREIDMAVRRSQLFKANPDKHSHTEGE